jgi:hypothetical protein
MTYVENLNALKGAYTGALFQYGIKSDEAQQAYKEYKNYKMIKNFDPQGIRKGWYDKADGQAARFTGNGK